jgi:hypothetical protein
VRAADSTYSHPVHKKHTRIGRRRAEWLHDTLTYRITSFSNTGCEDMTAHATMANDSTKPTRNNAFRPEAHSTGKHVRLFS